MSYDGFYAARRRSGERSSRDHDPSLHLEREKLRNAMKLKGRLEHIFEKYARDFSSVGDEIDLETGDIIVDNGHLAHMQHERDPGLSESSRFLRDMVDEIGDEDREEEEEDEEDTETGDQDDIDDGSEDDLAPERDEQVGQDRRDEQDMVENKDHDEDDEDELSIGHANSQRASIAHLSRQQTPAKDYVEDESDDHAAEMEDSADEYEPSPPRVQGHSSMSRPHSTASGDHEESEDPIIPSTEMTVGLPPISIEDSLNALVPHQDSSGRIDPAAIRHLGLSIANQIADFLTRATAGRLDPQPHVSRDPWSAPPLPEDLFRPQMSLDHGRETPRGDRFPSVMDSPGANSLWAPAPSGRRSRPVKRRKTHHQVDPRLLQEHRTPLHPNFDRGDSSTSETDSRGSSEAREAHAFAAAQLPHYQPMMYTRAGSKFRKEEDDLLRRLKDHDGLSWTQMTTFFPGRSPISLQTRYTRAIKRRPQPVIIKREIIEIVDGEDDTQSEGTPNWRVLPPDERQPQTPLLRQALHSGFNNRDDTPITVPDDDEDIEDEYTNSSQAYPAYANGSPSGYGYPPGYYFPPPSGQQAYPYPYNGFPSRNGMWYPPIPPHPKPRMKTPKPRKYHGKPESQPRYTRFDTTQGVGKFGILRTNQPVQMVSTPQQHLIGPRTETTGAFGMLKTASKKTEKAGMLAKAVRKGGYPNIRNAEAVASPGIYNSHSMNGQAHETATGMLQIMPPPRKASPHAFLRRTQSPSIQSPTARLNEQTNAPMQRARSEARGLTSETTPYPNTTLPERQNGPYYLSDISPAENHEPQPDGPSVNPTMDTFAPGSGGKDISSPLLPTPPSDASMRFSTAVPPISESNVAPLAQMVPPSSAVSGGGRAVFDKRAQSHTSPTPAGQSRGSSIGVVRKPFVAVEEPESADELA